jgi:hypothetical protein
VKEPVRYYSSYQPGLFDAVVMQYMDIDGMCMTLSIKKI